MVESQKYNFKSCPCKQVLLFHLLYFYTTSKIEEKKILKCLGSLRKLHYGSISYNVELNV